jgi:hypothetical protein
MRAPRAPSSMVAPYKQKFFGSFFQKRTAFFLTAQAAVP